MKNKSSVIVHCTDGVVVKAEPFEEVDSACEAADRALRKAGIPGHPSFLSSSFIDYDGYDFVFELDYEGPCADVR